MLGRWELIPSFQGLLCAFKYIFHSVLVRTDKDVCANSTCPNSTKVKEMLFSTDCYCCDETETGKYVLRASHMNPTLGIYSEEKNFRYFILVAKYY